MSSKKKSAKKKSLSTLNEESDNVLMTVQPTKKRKKIIKIETENTKKEKEEILKQNELKIQIKEIEDKINFEQNQHYILMSMKKDELFRKEKSIEQIEESNKNLQIEIDRLQKEIDTKLQKVEEKDKKEENNDGKNDMNNNKSEENINPIEKELKENEKEIESSRQIIDKYQKEVSNLQKTLNQKIDMTQLNSIKEEIKSTKERIDLMEKEKKYLLVISQEHNKCIEYQNRLQEDINHFQNELNLLKIENKEKVKIKIEKYKNSTKNYNNIYKGLSPEQIKQKKEQKIKNSLDEFWAVNKEKLLKCSLSENNLSNVNNNNNNNNINNDDSPNDISKIHKNNQSSKLLFKKKKRYGEGIKNFNFDINTNNALPVLPLFNNKEKMILLNVLPEEEIKKYEKRFECADAEKKNLQRLFAFETRQLLKENKDIKNKYDLNNIQLKENEHKNNLLTAQIEGETKEYEKLKNKMNNMMKEIEEKTKKLKQWEEENHTMALKLQEIKAKYVEIVKEEVEEEEELEEEEEEGDEDVK